MSFLSEEEEKEEKRTGHSVRHGRDEPFHASCSCRREFPCHCSGRTVQKKNEGEGGGESAIVSFTTPRKWEEGRERTTGSSTHPVSPSTEHRGEEEVSDSSNWERRTRAPSDCTRYSWLTRVARSGLVGVLKGLAELLAVQGGRWKATSAANADPSRDNAPARIEERGRGDEEVAGVEETAVRRPVCFRSRYGRNGKVKEVDPGGGGKKSGSRSAVLSLSRGTRFDSFLVPHIKVQRRGISLR